MCSVWVCVHIPDQQRYDTSGVYTLLELVRVANILKAKLAVFMSSGFWLVSAF